MNKLIFVLIISLFSSLSFGFSQDEAKKYDELEGLAYIKALNADKKYIWSV